MAATVTATGVVGPAITLTTGVFTDVRAVHFDCINNILELTMDSDYIQKIAITAATTITATKSGSTYTFTVS